MISRTAEVATPTESSCAITPYSCRLWVNRVVLAPCLQLPVHSRERTSLRFLGLFGAPSMEAHGTTATSEPAPCGRSARSQAVVYSAVPACDGLRFHSATAQQYCSSSSFVALQSRTCQKPNKTGHFTTRRQLPVKH